MISNNFDLVANRFVECLHRSHGLPARIQLPIGPVFICLGLKDTIHETGRHLQALLSVYYRNCLLLDGGPSGLGALPYRPRRGINEDTGYRSLAVSKDAVYRFVRMLCEAEIARHGEIYGMTMAGINPVNEHLQVLGLVPKVL